MNAVLAVIGNALLAVIVAVLVAVHLIGRMFDATLEFLFFDSPGRCMFALMLFAGFVGYNIGRDYQRKNGDNK